MKHKKIALWGLLSGLLLPVLLDLFLGDRAFHIILAWIVIPILAALVALGAHRADGEKLEFRVVAKGYVFGLIGFGLFWLLAILVFSVLFSPPLSV